jgi:cytidylate kinase
MLKKFKTQNNTNKIILVVSKSVEKWVSKITDQNKIRAILLAIQRIKIKIKTVFVKMFLNKLLSKN